MIPSAVRETGARALLLPFAVDGADEANPLRLDDFDWLLSRAVARAQTR